MNLLFLAETAGAVTVKRFTQKLLHPDSKTFVGKGKLEEIKNYCELKNVRILIFDDELSGSQITNIEKATDVKTIDRSDLILDIFARRAKTAQAKAQVELALLYSNLFSLISKSMGFPVSEEIMRNKKLQLQIKIFSYSVV